MKSGCPLTGRFLAKYHPFKEMKREIAAAVLLCAACVKGASRLDGHKDKRTSTMSLRHRTPEKKKGKEAGDDEEQSSERKSTRGPRTFDEFLSMAVALRRAHQH